MACLALAACSPGTDDAALRFEAERARWQLDRGEARGGGAASASPAVREWLRSGHADLARRFGPPGPVQAPPADADRQVRYRLAGSSALFAAELGEGLVPDDALRAEFAEIATRYAFDPQISVRARVREGLAAEAQGRAIDALQAYRLALEHGAEAAVAAAVPAQERMRADLELHATLLALRATPESAPGWLEQARTRMRRRVEVFGDAAGGAELRRRHAELLAIAGDPDQAVRVFVELVPVAAGAEESAEISVRAGEVEEHYRGRPAEAEIWYRRAAGMAPGRPIGAEARLLLGHFLARQGRAREAVDAYTLAIASSLTAGPALRAESMHGRGAALETLGRWEDSIPALSKAAKERGPFALAAAARLSRKFREIAHPEREARTSAFVARASAPPDSVRPSRALHDLADAIGAVREAQAWGEVVDELAVLATLRAGTALADSARSARARIEANGLTEGSIPGRGEGGS